MNLSIWLLTASLTAGAPTDGQPCTTCQPQQVIYTQNPQPQQQQQQMRTGILPSLRARFENLRHRDAGPNVAAPATGPQVVYTQPAAQAQPTTQVMYGRPMPLSQHVMQPMAGPAPGTYVVPASAQDTPLPEVTKQFQNKVGAADDYTWITGQLFYVHVDGGRWVLRYASVEQEDKYGGSVVLAPAVDMKNYREGDLVSVNGEVLGQARATRSLGGPLYRVDAVNMIERADR